MVHRLVLSTGVATLSSLVITPLSYLVFRDSTYAKAISDNADLVVLGIGLLVLAVLEVSWGLVLCFSIVGAFEVGNLMRGTLSLVIGALVGAAAVIVLENVLTA